MAYLTDMPKTCRDRATRPEHALDLLDSVRKEFDKGFNGGIFDPGYVLQKLDTLRRHVKWLQGEAERERAAEFAAEVGAMADCDCPGCDNCGTHCVPGCASGEGTECRV